MPDGNTPSTSGKKTYYIIGAIVILLLLGWVLTRGIGAGMMAASGVNMNSAPGGGTTYTDSQGNSATVGGTTMPDNWPADAPANYAGATISYSGNSNPQTGKAGAAVVYTANASAQDVVNYYKTQLTSKGWTIAATANTGGATVLSATKDTRALGLYIVSTGNNAVSVTVGLGTQ